jgi:hypothetical protein
MVITAIIGNNANNTDAIVFNLTFIGFIFSASPFVSNVNLTNSLYGRTVNYLLLIFTTIVTIINNIANKIANNKTSG